MNENHPNSKSPRLYELETSLELLANRYGLSQSSMIDFSLNVNPLGCSPAAITAAREAMGNANFYPDINLSALRAALSNKYRHAKGKFLFGAGLDDVIKLLIHAWTAPGDTILIHLPTFPRYALEAQLHGCEVIGVKGGASQRFDADRYTEALRSNRITMAFICSPNNPTGELIDIDVIEEMARSFPQTIFVADEALINPKKEGCLRLPDKLNNIAVMRTFSKFFGLAGMRVGFVVAAEKLIDTAEMARPPFNVSRPAAAAAVAALEDEEFIARCDRTFLEESNYFRERISQKLDIGVLGSHGNMMLLELQSQSSAQAAAKIARKGIVVADATSFDGLQETATLRVSLRSRKENEKLISALLTL
ncbi:aminotransferase class I/II-fold pyridoxal phosphate-dependent enzyme [Burkholderia sp. FERM BP-3421]|uniref:pyridoxal phosphate-dependent aminotransferase n=1 Tax=Burkholderia sp. FERM BP-3421 TaxID=1494466 RepID=UPI002360C503|nr:histidinol-phosphate transaminase [Burkholderia sp. FERM BP-3421]WDD93548.1 aminotransferase class I/II-fold pyridoxal phosphate-dependent enzyme [Burkholderia sp. FERM BP-3421]